MLSAVHFLLTSVSTLISANLISPQPSQLVPSHQLYMVTYLLELLCFAPPVFNPCADVQANIIS